MNKYRIYSEVNIFDNGDRCDGGKGLVVPRGCCLIMDDSGLDRDSVCSDLGLLSLRLVRVALLLSFLGGFLCGSVV